MNCSVIRAPIGEIQIRLELKDKALEQRVTLQLFSYAAELLGPTKGELVAPRTPTRREGSGSPAP